MTAAISSAFSTRLWRWPTGTDFRRVERSPNDHVAFGGYGAHFCLGAPLARLELRLMFEELIGRVTGLELVDSDPLPIRKSNFIAGIERMEVRLGPS